MIEKIGDLTGSGGVGGIKGKRGTWLDYDAGELSLQEDGVAVSAFAREMARVSAELAKVPEVRESRVRDLKEQIDSGTYKPDVLELAKRLVWAGIVKGEE